MSLLTVFLSHSGFLRPWVRFSALTTEALSRTVQSSALYEGVSKTFSGCFGLLDPLLNRVAHPYALYFLLLGLLVSLTFCSTETIGAITWLTFLYSLLVLRKSQDACWIKQLSPIDLAVVLFFATALISTAFSSYLGASLHGLAKMITFLAGYTSFRIAFILRNTLSIPIMVVLLLLGSLQTGVGFYQFTHHIEPLATWQDTSIQSELVMTRVFGTLIPPNPNLLAGFLVLCFAAGTGVVLWGISKKSLPVSLIALLMSGGILAGILLTGSRGGYLAIGAMGLMIFLGLGHLFWHDTVLKTHRRLKTLWAVTLVFSLLCAAWLLISSPQLQHRLGSIFAMRNDSSISYRINVYQSTWRMIQDNPVIGIGPGNDTYKQVYGLYMTPGYNALGAYSVPLEIWAEQGIVGLLAFLWLLGVLFLRGFLYLESPTHYHNKWIALAWMTGIIGSLMYGVFDTIWYRPSVNLVFWLFVAALAAQMAPLSLSPSGHFLKPGRDDEKETTP